LIKKCIDALSKQIKEKPKVGDLIKMMEFRLKLAPGDSGKKDLLAMLEKIRRENLPADKSPRNKKSGSRSKTKPSK